MYGCGLTYLRTKLEEHYNEAKRFNKLSIRLIGKQAIFLARYSYRLVNCLKTDNETVEEKLKRLALQLEEFCQLYFSMLVLFSPKV